MKKQIWGAATAAMCALLVVPACVDKLGDDCSKSQTCADSSTGGNPDGNAGASTGGMGEGGQTTGGTGTGGKATGGAATGGNGTGGASDACDPACSGSTPVCDEKGGACVGCLKDGDCKDGAPLCDTTSHECVECKESADCTEVSKSVCSGSACTACTKDADCAHLSSTPLCDVAAGTCIECQSEADCSGKVCDPSAHACTTLDAHVLNACEACEHDAECQVGQVCVEMSYDDPTTGVVGQFCLWRKNATAVGAPNGTCGLSSRPFASQAAVTSVDGAAATVCTLATTTCPALQQFRTPMAGCDAAGDDDACGAAGFSDGRCRLNTSSEPQCTYPCAGNQDCKPGFKCPTSGDQYCAL